MDAHRPSFGDVAIACAVTDLIPEPAQKFIGQHTVLCKRWPAPAQK